MAKKATIIAVVNQKGGTGKTTTTENLGVGLALEGKKVLLVDTDPQASLTVSLGNPCPDDLSPTLSDLMGKIIVWNDKIVCTIQGWYFYCDRYFFHEPHHLISTFFSLRQK